MGKTEQLKRIDIATEKLHPNPFNPNEMGAKQFNLLYDNIERVGLTDPILVRPHPEIEGEYRIVGGQHRWEAAKMLDFETVPCTVIEDESFTEDEEKFQLMRHNMIRGKLSPKKFLDMYKSLEGDYENELASEMFGFASEEEFLKLVSDTKKALPKEMQKEFENAKDEIKTIDDLARVLNELFAKFGDTLPYNYMILDYGGKETVWIRMEPDGFSNLLELANRCRDASRTMDALLEGLIDEAAEGNLDDLLQDIFARSEEVEIESDFNDLPVVDFLD